MKIIKDARTSLAHNGYITLQVPDVEIALDGVASTIEELPDDWFFYLNLKRSQPVPCIGKENGFLYYTRKGWEANKTLLKEAFESSPTPRGTWTEFIVYAEEFFDKIEEGRQKQIAYYQEKIDQLKVVVI